MFALSVASFVATLVIAFTSTAFIDRQDDAATEAWISMSVAEYDRARGSST